MRCPRCQREVPDGDECVACGVVISKFQARAAAAALKEAKPPSPQPRTLATAPSPLAGRSVVLAVPTRRLATLYGELSRLLETGIPPASVFYLLETHSHGRVRRAAEKARKRIDAGDQFWEALAQSPEVFPPQAISLVAAAEQSGSLPTAFRALAASAELKLQLRQRLLRVCLYPFILFSLSFFLLPLSTLVTKGVSAYLREALGPYLLALASLFAVFVALPRLLETTIDRRLWQRVALAVPLLGAVRRLRHRAEFSSQLATALAAGLDMAASLRLAALASGQHYLLDVSEKAIAHIDRGATLAEALRQAGVTDGEFLLSVSSGEASGKLPEALEQQARLSQQAYLHRLEVAVQLVAVFLLLVVYAFVVWRVVAQYRDIMHGYQGQLDQLLKEMGGGDMNHLLRGGSPGGDLPPELRGILP